jgi:outer membrane protein assembly factor BamB
MNRLLLTLTTAIASGVFAISSSVAAVTGGLANSPWPDYGGGLSNTHRTTVIGPASQPHVIWQYAVSDVGNSFNRPYRQAVLGDDGTIYFATYSPDHGQVIALHPDGSVKWDQPGGAIGNWLAVDSNGQLYNEGWPDGSNGGSIYARSQTTGSVIWAQPYRGTPIEAGPTVGNDGTVYTSAGGLTKLTQGGQQAWQIGNLETQYRNPAIAPDGTIYIDGQAVLSAVNPNGGLLWSTTVGKRLGPVTIDGNANLFVGTANEPSPSFYSFTSGGVLRWQRSDIGGAAAVGPDGTIYAGYQGTLHALRPDTGVDLWAYQTGQIDEFGVEGVTVDAQGNLYLANEQGVLMSLSSSGSLRWKIDLAPSVTGNVYLGAPIIGTNGVLYVPGGDTRMFFAVGVPEPTTATLLLLGMLGCGCRRRQKAHRS